MALFNKPNDRHTRQARAHFPLAYPKVVRSVDKAYFKEVLTNDISKKRDPIKIPSFSDLRKKVCCKEDDPRLI